MPETPRRFLLADQRGPTKVIDTTVEIAWSLITTEREKRHGEIKRGGVLSVRRKLTAGILIVERGRWAW